MDTAKANDAGIAVVNELFQVMQIDEEWSVREDRGFSWWPYVLAQRVWATPAADRMGVRMCQVHVETDLVRDVSVTDDVLHNVAEVNRFASLSNCVLHEGRLRLHASVSVSTQNLIPATLLAKHAMALQLAESYSLLQTLHACVSGVTDSSVHPETGARETPDDMLNVASIYAKKTRVETLALRLGFEQLADDPHRCWALATASANGFTAEFPLTRNAVPAIACDGVLETALYEAQIMEHPRWGAGVATRLRMPSNANGRTDLVNHLNITETLSPDSHQLGAWSLQGDTLQFVSFFPAIVFPENGEAAAALFLGVVWHQASRALWANAVLAPEWGDGLH